MNKKGIIWFDCDGVLTDQESSWNYLHKYFGSSCNYLFSQMYKKGYIDYLDWMKIDIALMINSYGKLIERKDLENILNNIKIRESAYRVFNILRKHFIIGIISSGVDILVRRVCSELNSDICLYNELRFIDNILVPGGVANVPLKEKPVIIKNYSEKLGFTLDKTVYIGDSEWDIDVFKIVGLPIAIKPCNNACEYAKYVVNDLDEIIDIIYSYFELNN